MYDGRGGMERVGERWGRDGMEKWGRGGMERWGGVRWRGREWWRVGWRSGGG